MITAITLYAFMGSPTPDYPGWVEAAIGALMVLAAGPGVISALGLNGSFKTLRLFFFYGLTVPTLSGFFQGYDLVAVARDGAAFLFLCLPLFFTKLVACDETRIKIYIAAIVGLGLVFALRALAPAYGYAPPSGELYYLTNCPTVLFAAIFTGGMVLRLSGQSLTARSIIMMSGAAAIMMIIIWGMLLDVQRATISAVIVSFIFFTLLLLIRAPGRVLMPLMLCGLVVTFFYPVLMDAVQAIAQKTAQVGLNMRLEELRAVIDRIDGSLWTILFGAGWGAKMASPAVGGVAVAFTHSLLSYVLLKTGLCGLGLAVIWLFGCLKRLIAVFYHDQIIGTALAWSIAIPVFLYASHKSLDFGLVLLLLTVLADGGHARLARANAPV